MSLGICLYTGIGPMITFNSSPSWVAGVSMNARFDPPSGYWVVVEGLYEHVPKAS